MREHREEEVELRKYLLGELTLEQQVLIEQRLFLDDKYSRLAQAVADELIDDYEYHDLTENERAHFQSHFLRRSDHREDLRIARALKRFVISQPIVVGQESFFRSVFQHRLVVGLSFAALLIIFSVVGWKIFQSLRRQDEPPVLQGQDQGPSQTTPPEGNRNSNEPQPQEAANRSGNNRGPAEASERRVNERSRPQAERSSSPSPSTIVLAIPPGVLTRGEQQANRDVTISAETETLILRLAVPTEHEYERYLAILKSRGRTVRNFSNLTSEPDQEWGKVVPVRVPARILRPQNYEIELSGISSDQRAVEPTTYSFQVDRK